MTQPSPDPPGASHGDPPPIHLACTCQRGQLFPLSLCGFVIDLGHASAGRDGDVDVDTGRIDRGDRVVEVGCVVCLDLARSALVAGRCERCVP